MIKADPGWVAQYEYQGMDEDVPIVAWSSAGGPLVVEWSTGNLVPPRELRDKGSFRRVVHKHTYATVPGAGWKLRRRCTINGQDHWDEYGVAAFEFRQDGAVLAVVIDSYMTPRRYFLGQDEDIIEVIAPEKAGL